MRNKCQVCNFQQITLKKAILITKKIKKDIVPQKSVFQKLTCKNKKYFEFFLNSNNILNYDSLGLILTIIR